MKRETPAITAGVLPKFYN